MSMTYPRAAALAIHGNRGLRAAGACGKTLDRIPRPGRPDKLARRSEIVLETAEDGLEVME
jgi:hypothetical protein